MTKVAIPRRRALLLSGGALAAPMIASGIARAQSDWPNRPVKYIVVFPAGGPTDTLSRIVCQELSELTGQQFIIENRAGSGGNIGADAIAKSAARRLHDRPLHDRRACHRAHALHQAAVRRGQGLHRRRHAVGSTQTC